MVANRTPMVEFHKIIPKPLNTHAIHLAIKKEAEYIGEAILTDYKDTTATWKKKPKFKKEVIVTPGDINIVVSTQDEIYKYVDKGTKKHIIRPRPENKSQRLWFREGFEPKTQPGILGSTQGRSFGALVAAREVMHPGTRARKFSQLIRKLWRKEFRIRMYKAMGRAADASGHLIK